MIETTAAIIKSKAVRRGLDGEVIIRILSAGGITIARCEVAMLNEDKILSFYREHVGRPYFMDLFQSVSDQVVILALEGDDVIARWRRMMGPTDPKKAENCDIRWLAFDEPVMADNIVHGSDSREAANRELSILFGADWVRRNVTPS